MTRPTLDPFGAIAPFSSREGKSSFYRLARLEEKGVASLSRLPFSIKILLEAALRQVNGHEVKEEDVLALARWSPRGRPTREVPFCPARVLLQDFTGVPAIVDLAALRSALKQMGGDPRRIEPLVPVDLVIDHSVQVDRFGTPDALRANAEIEFARNRERYEFLKWGRTAFRRLRVVPPATGIVHQVNLEYLAQCVRREERGGEVLVFPDTLVGTDSHTTMVNGLGVAGWGVGGIEAEAVMLGQPLYMLSPDVVGFRLSGELPEGATATDLVLTVTQTLRKKGVVDKFVEFHGPGVSRLTLPDRATIANMAPEYGATMGFFPVDSETLRFLAQTGRSPDLVDRVERYTKEQGLFRTDFGPSAEYSDTAELDLGTIEPSLAGPRRPQDRVRLAEMKSSFAVALGTSPDKGGFGVPSAALARRAPVSGDGHKSEVGHGAVVIAAITSCTNTSNPSVMLAAGLLAKKAVERGLTVPGHVKTSLAPGSRVVSGYLKAAGLLPYLEKLRFHLVGYGCTTCIGNSGPLPEPVAKAVKENDLVAVAVLSGNRNFSGRIHPLVKAAYLASPPLVVAFALAGRADLDLLREPIGMGSDGKPVFFREIWPSQREIADAIARSVSAKIFSTEYANVFDGNETWNAIPASGGEVYRWSESSTYIQEPPFFLDMPLKPPGIRAIRGARVLALLGDSVTTDHISPAGDIAKDSPAGRYLVERGVGPADFNTYGARRGNDRVMTRGTFANIRIRNALVPGVEGPVTVHFPTGKTMPVHDAAELYKKEGTPLLVLAGKEYGTGSSRDWAAKGTLLLGVKAVIAESYERIHRANLVGMGVLPLEFLPDQSAASLGLTGREVYEVEGLLDTMAPGSPVVVRATQDGKEKTFQAKARLDSAVDVSYYANGGILNFVLRNFLGSPDR
ncbi:MAG: aconitate hydratase AcnA [Planctomycetes bacterium]|nr:aconitate hydratase AcnA [Planctomycetota bacterium]